MERHQDKHLVLEHCRDEREAGLSGRSIIIRSVSALDCVMALSTRDRKKRKNRKPAIRIISILRRII